MPPIEETNPLCLFNLCSKTIEGYYGPAFQTLGIVIFVIIFNFLFKTLLVKLSERFSKQQKVWSWSLVTALQRPFSYYVWFVAIICAIDIITEEVFGFHLTDMHLILSIGSVLAFGWFLLRLNIKMVHAMMEMSQNRRIPLTPGKLDIMSKLATMAIIFFTVFLLMDVTGRSVQTLIAFGGIGGLALAFASQQVVSNFFGGLMVYITQPFTIGEWVYLPERKVEGHIEEIGWYLTRIRNFEKRPIYIPNSVFTQTIVITPSRMSHERFHTTIGLRYNDINVVKPIIDDIKLMLLKHPHIDQQQKVEVFFINFGPSTLDIEVSAYMSKLTGTDFKVLKQEILLKISEIIAEHGAQMAFPTSIVEIQGAVFSKESPLTA